MRVAWNLKGGGILSFTLTHDKLPVLHVYSSAIPSGCQKTRLTSGFDMIGPYLPVPNSMDSNILQEFFIFYLKAFSAYGFRVAIVLCDGASSNLTLLKILCGCPRATCSINDEAAVLRDLTDHAMPFWFFPRTGYVMFFLLSKSRGRKDVPCSTI